MLSNFRTCLVITHCKSLTSSFYIVTMFLLLFYALGLLRGAILRYHHLKNVEFCIKSFILSTNFKKLYEHTAGKINRIRLVLRVLQPEHCF